MLLRGHGSRTFGLYAYRGRAGPRYAVQGRQQLPSIRQKTHQEQ